MPPLLIGLSTTTNEANDGLATAPTSQSILNYVEEQLTTKQLDLYKMYTTTGLNMDNFSKLQSLEELQQFAKRSGNQHGSGMCF